ncbi:ABC transporter substrate-binding protein [Clostridium sp. DJ247]|uniref:ABC transporter substrate-binding protein n=1 Tax=Clostridium sp. DJ247 TaxID=2726188 RepID=UPI00162ADA05|nr:ABC transporter substrate-binding protein [Clostridium sp. DJ247]MBC2580710.1 ABC transporter substrate-binding protein [Clostridium sp. DJ247]
MLKNRKQKKLFLLISAITIAATLGMTGCGKNTAATSGGSANALKADADGLIPIKTWTRVDCSSTPWIVADKKGFFKEEGLKIVYTGETQATQQIPSILNGNNDFGGWHPNTFAVAKASGAPLVGISPAGIEPGPEIDPKFRHMWWFVNPKSGIKSVEDLKNYKKGQKLKFSTITNNICADFLANKILDKYGIPRDRVEWVSMPDVQAVQALSQGLVDVAGVHPPYYKAMQDSGAVKIVDTSEANLGASAGLSFYVVSEDFAKKNPDVVKRFTRAMAKAGTWANANYIEAAKLTEEAIHQPVTGYHYYATSTKIDESLVKPWIEDLEKNNVIPKDKITASNLVTHDFEDKNEK